MKERSFTLTVILILAAAMFAGNLNSNPIGNFFKLEERYPLCDCREIKFDWECKEMCPTKNACKTVTKTNWNCNKDTLCKNANGKISMGSSLGLKPYKKEVAEEYTGNC